MIRFFQVVLSIGIFLLQISCGGKLIKDVEEDFKRIESFDQKIKVKNIEKKKEKPKQKKKIRKAMKQKKEEVKGRRPPIDPYRVGESIDMSLSYFGIKAGNMVFQVNPFKEINGKKSYHFSVTVKSNKLFSKFYYVNNSVDVYLDYNLMIPYSFSLSVNETNEIKESRSYFNWKEKKAYFWEKKINKKKEKKEEEYNWDIVEYAQSVFSAPFYLRSLQLSPGEEIEYPIANKKKNMLLKVKILRKEEIKVKAGTFNTVVVSPELQIEGVLKQTRKAFIWLTDDDRKFIVKIESEAKVGKLKAEAVSIQP